MVPLRHLPPTARRPRGTAPSRRRGRGAVERCFPRTEPRGSAGAPAPSRRPLSAAAIGGEPALGLASATPPLVGPRNGAGAARRVLSVRGCAVVASSPRASRMALARLPVAMPVPVHPLRLQCSAETYWHHLHFSFAYWQALPLQGTSHPTVSPCKKHDGKSTSRRHSPSFH